MTAESPVLIAPPRYVLLNLANLLTGYSVKAMERKIELGDCRRGACGDALPMVASSSTLLATSAGWRSGSRAVQRADEGRNRRLRSERPRSLLGWGNKRHYLALNLFTGCDLGSVQVMSGLQEKPVERLATEVSRQSQSRIAGDATPFQ